MQKLSFIIISLFLLNFGSFENETVPKITGIIDLNHLDNYANQFIPTYITKDNTPFHNPITDAGATLGRVLFYDKNLSKDNSISCASCHLQAFAFSDTAAVSQGVNGTTGRHSMRLINVGFSEEVQFFWDERAESLEAQTTMPIQDHIEMGFSGENGDPAIDSLFKKLEALEYYQILFPFVFGDTQITETRLQKTLAQFVRSIQSFDSKYDEGRAAVTTDLEPFPNFTLEENNGKALFLESVQFDLEGNRIGGGAGCNSCHRAPEFDIDPFSISNGIVGSSNGGLDFSNTKAPSLRDILDEEGNPYGGFMHNAGTGIVDDLETLFSFYDDLPGHLANPPFLGNIDFRLSPNGHLQKLHLTATEKSDLIAFLKTLTGTNVYTDLKWSDPFLEENLTVIPPEDTRSSELFENADFKIYPNPASQEIFLDVPASIVGTELIIYNTKGEIVDKRLVQKHLNISKYPDDFYFLKINQTVLKFYKTSH